MTRERCADVHCPDWVSFGTHVSDLAPADLPLDLGGLDDVFMPQLERHFDADRAYLDRWPPEPEQTPDPGCSWVRLHQGNHFWYEQRALGALIYPTIRRRKGESYSDLPPLR